MTSTKEGTSFIKTEVLIGSNLLTLMKGDEVATAIYGTTNGITSVSAILSDFSVHNYYLSDTVYTIRQSYAERKISECKTV